MIVRDARRQDLAFEDRCRERRALQLLDGVEQRIDASPRRADAVPRQQEPPERVGLDRLDLLPQPRERAAAQAAQDVGVDPFAIGAARTELALDEAARLGQPRQQRFGDGDAKPVSLREHRGR